MAYTAIDDPSAYFKVQLYSGDGTAIGSGGQVITFDDTDTDMQPDLVWVKSRTDSQNHNVSDSVRGGTKTLYGNSTYFEETKTEAIASFQSDGFTVGNWEQVNDSGDTFVAWCWKESATAGFDIVTYEGVGVGTETNVSHSLSAVPEFYVVKSRESHGGWQTYHHKMSAAPETDYIQINTNAAVADYGFWGDTAPTSSVFTVDDGDDVNAVEDYVCYLWRSVQGYSKFGGWTGNGDADGVFNYTGFRPAYVMIKRTDDVESWLMMDNKRLGYNPNTSYILSNATNAETTGSPIIDFCANGFKMKATDRNESSAEYVYMAFAEAPLVNSNGVPCNAR